MADIASHSCYATTGFVYDLHHISRLVLHQIREEHRIAVYDQEASTSHGSSIRPLVSSIRGRGRGRVDPRGCGGDGGQDHGRDGKGGRGTPVTPQTRGSVDYPSTRGNTRECRVTRHFSRKSGRVSFVRGALPKYRTCINLSQTVQYNSL